MPFPRCEKCGSILSCTTDSFTMVQVGDKVVPGYGRMSYIHDGPCIPKPVRAAELDDDDRPKVMRQCIECHLAFEVPLEAASREICSGHCRDARQRRLKREGIERAKERDAA